MNNLATRFNKSADHCYKIALNKGFLSFCFAAGATALPFSVVAGVTIMAAPTIYAGFGLIQHGVAKAIDRLMPGST